MPSSNIRKQVNPLILIVEDNRINQLLMLKKFEKQGFNSIMLAKNGQEALEMALKNNPDLILMDIQKNSPALLLPYPQTTRKKTWMQVPQPVPMAIYPNQLILILSFLKSANS
jgi:DNA-binding NtrC family response regulator